MSEKRTCGPRKSNKHPDAYSTKELVRLARKHLIPKFKIADISGMTKGKLCIELSKVAPDLINLEIIEESAPEKEGQISIEGIQPLSEEEKKIEEKKLLQEKKEAARQKYLAREKLRKEFVLSQPSYEQGCFERGNVDVFPYQKRVVNQLLKQRGLLAIHSTGTGKTLTAVVSSQCLLDFYPDMRVIVVSPKSLIDNFRKEMIKYGLNQDDPRYYFYSYEAFSSAYREAKSRPIICENCFLIIDEAHNLRTSITKSKSGAVSGIKAITLIKCAMLAKKVLLLTATPIVNKETDIINLMAIVRGEEPLTKSHFEHMIGNPRSFNLYFGCRVSMYNNVDRTLFPRVIDTNVEIEMSNKFYNAYYKIQENVFSMLEIKEEFAGLIIKSKYALAIIVNIRRSLNLNPLLENEFNKPKIDWILQKVLSEPESKFVIYSSWIEAGVELVMSEFEKHSIKAVLITGEVSQTQRRESMEKYNSGEIQVLFISKAGSEGLDLKGTTHLIIMDLPWNKAALDQIKGRAVRYKSHTHLPPELQTVYIWTLYVIKPHWEKKDDFGNYVRKISKVKNAQGKHEFIFDDEPSIDLRMKKYIDSKEKLTQLFMEKLEDVSIERKRC